MQQMSFFASKDRLIKDEDPIFFTDKYDRPWQMDGWLGVKKPP
jgi:Allantoicase